MVLFEVSEDSGERVGESRDMFCVVFVAKCELIRSLQ